MLRLPSPRLYFSARAITLFKTAHSSIPRYLLIDLSSSERRGSDPSQPPTNPPVAVKLMKRDQTSSSPSTSSASSTGKIGGKKVIVLATRGPQQASPPAPQLQSLSGDKRGTLPVKSVSEREKEYAEARARIFGTKSEDSADNKEQVEGQLRKNSQVVSQVKENKWDEIGSKVRIIACHPYC